MYLLVHPYNLRSACDFLRGRGPTLACLYGRLTRLLGWFSPPGQLRRLRALIKEHFDLAPGFFWLSIPAPIFWGLGPSL